MLRAVLASLLLAALAAPPLAGQVFRTGIDLVHFEVAVVDRQGNFITGLTADDFEIYEEGTRQTIEHFVAGRDGDPAAPPLRLGLLVDTSGSMAEDMRFARTAVISFVNALPQALDITLVEFDSEVRVARFSQADYPRLVERIRMREADGWTALYDALGVYLHAADQQEGQKVLVVYTDGGDTRSAMRLGDVLMMLRASDVTLYAVGLLEHQRPSTRASQRLGLEQLAGITGGHALFPRSAAQLDEMYDQILKDIRARYTLGYASTDTRTDGTWRRVDVRLARPDLRGARVRTRAGYFALYRDEGSRP